MKLVTYCSRCSQILGNEDRFCKHCGTEAGGKTPGGSAPVKNDSGVVFPERPVLKLQTRSCPGCGAQISGDAIICVKCGYNFETGQPTRTVRKRQFPIRSYLYPVFEATRTFLRIAVRLAIAAGIAVGACFFAHRVAQEMGVCHDAGFSGNQFVPGGMGNALPGGGVAAAPAADYASVYNRAIEEFVPPETNQFVRLDLKAGGRMQGRLVEVSTNAVMLETSSTPPEGSMVVGCLRCALAPESRIRFFREDYAAYHAKLAMAGDGAGSAVQSPVGGNGESRVPEVTYASVPVTCPSCHGERYYMIARNPPVPSVREACPLCIARGTKILRQPNGTTLCPDCGGWGSTWYAESATQMRKTMPCARCNTKGFVGTAVPTVPAAPVVPQPPTPPAPTPPGWLPFVRVLDGFWHQILGLCHARR